MVLVPVPPIYLRERRFDLDVPGQGNRSDWTGTRQYVGLPGAETWYAQAAFMPAATERNKRLLRAFLLSLRGGQNWFRFPRSPGQFGGANPTVAAVLDDNTVTLNSAAGIVAGMWATFTYGGKFRLVGLKGDPAGNTISFEPFLRAAPAAGSVVEFRNPFCEMVLTNARNGFDTDEGVDTLEIQAEER